MATTQRRKLNPIPAHVRRAVRERFIACYYCGAFPEPWGAFPPRTRLEVDHLVPLEMGGTSDEANLVMACASCNRAKGAKPVAQFVGHLQATWTRFGMWGG